MKAFDRIRRPGPGQFLLVSILLALATGAMVLALGSETQGLVRFLILLDALLFLALGLYLVPARILPERTRNLLQMAYLMLGGLMSLSGILGVFNQSFSVGMILVLMLLLPGSALIWVGFVFRTRGSAEDD